MPIQYCFDTNVLIEPWNNYYSPKLCPNYWDVLENLIKQGTIFCTEEVYREISKVDDELYEWVKNNPSFIRTFNEDIQDKLRRILKVYPRLVDTKHDRSMADPWVIAHAWSEMATVVTKEMPTNSLRTVRIPDVCKHFSIRCINDFQFLEEIGITFHAIQ